jgi:tRNA-splicing ligase RtcB
MGTASYLLEGTEKAMQQTFGSSCHGSGRRMSRHKALKHFSGKEVKQKLESRGILTRSPGFKGLAEETPEAYKDVDEVVNSVVDYGINIKVARFKPMGVLKG